jgi:hypothetical protein
MSINCLCQITTCKSPSWLKITVKRMDGLDRDYSMFVYKVNTIGICSADFARSKTEEELSEFKNISYQGMKTEQANGEARAFRNSKWFVWNNSSKAFNYPIKFGLGKYWIVKFPREYWDFRQQYRHQLRHLQPPQQPHSQPPQQQS